MVHITTLLSAQPFGPEKEAAFENRQIEFLEIAVTVLSFTAKLWTGAMGDFFARPGRTVRQTG